MSEINSPDVFRLLKYYKFHNHELNKKVTKDLNKWFNKKDHKKRGATRQDAKFKNTKGVDKEMRRQNFNERDINLK